MRLAKHCFLAIIVAVAAMTGSSYAQALKLVPATALAVIHVNSLDATSKKISDLAGALGLINMQPELQDPLGSMLKSMGITAGVNRQSDMALFIVDPASVDGKPDKAVVALFPTSDYQAFIGNFPDAKTEGEVTTVQLKGDANVSYMAHWGDYIALSDGKELVTKKPDAFLDVAGLAAKELDNKDLVIYGNMKALRAKILPEIEKGRTFLQDQVDQAVQSNRKFGAFEVSKFGPLLKVVINQVLDLGNELANDTDAATYSTNLSPDGIATTFLVEFNPDSKMGKYASQVKNSDAPLLGGLPDGKYLFAAGEISDGKLTSQWLSDFVAPIQKAVTDLGADYAPVNDMIEAGKAMIAAQTGSAMGMMAPSGVLGQGAIFQLVGVRNGDSHAIMDAFHKSSDAQPAMMKALGLQTPGTQQSYLPASKQLDGVTFDEVKTTFNMNGQPGGAMAGQFLTMLYGPDGLEMYMGVVNDKTMLYSAGLSDTNLSASIASAKTGEDALSKNNAVKAVAGQLPPQRVAVAFVPLDVWASTGLAYAKQFAMDMGVKIPDDLPPIGLTAGTEGSAIRYDAYIPTQLIQALTSAGMQLYMSQRQQMNQGNGNGGGNGAGGGGPAGGGL